MAHRARRVIRRKPDEAEEIEDEEEIEETEEEVEEEEVEVVKPVRRAARKIEPVEEDEEEEIDEEEDEPAPVKAKPVAKPTVKIGVPLKAAKKVVEPEEDEEEDDEEPAAKPAKVSIRKVDGLVAENVITGIMDALEVGKSIVITKTDDGQWQFASADKFKNPDKMRGKEYWDQVKNPEYEKWMEEWHNLTYAEKAAKAKKAGVKWEAHTNPKIDVIRLTAAMRAHLGIEKYREEYQSRTARAALRG